LHAPKEEINADVFIQECLKIKMAQKDLARWRNQVKRDVDKDN
jgi:hypothetical protein